MTLLWIKLAWKLCLIRYTDQSTGVYIYMCVFKFLLTSVISLLFSLPPDLGWLHQLPQRSVSGLFLVFTLWDIINCVSQQLNADILVLCSISEAVGSYAENQRITAVRRVYQRGCVNPMINIEQLWRDYSKYEEASDPLQTSGLHRSTYICLNIWSFDC